MAGVVLKVTDDTFEAEVLQADEPVLVDFWAEWCGPCKKMAPMLDELANEYASRLRVAKLDIDVNRATTTTYGILSIPTMKLFRGGKVVHTVVGAKPKSALLKEIREHVKLGATH